MVNYKWKHKDKRFPLSNLEPTLLFTNNYAANIVPEESSANLNIRFGGDYDFNSLKQIMLDEAKEFGLFLEFHQSGESYYCDNEKLKRLLSTAIKETINIDPVFSAAGGTSDGRHMIRYCNVIEFGPLDTTMHQKNERIKISDLQKLEEIYFAFLQKYFA
jgi:succinyl-diaminopimelate desuccinylase